MSSIAISMSFSTGPYGAPHKWAGRALKSKESIIWTSHKEDDLLGYADDRASSDQSDFEETQAQFKVCKVCYNLNLFVGVLEDTATGLQDSTANVFQDQVVRDEIRTKCLLRLEFYDVLESARTGGCTYCRFLVNCLRTQGAEPGESKSTIISIVALPQHPFYIYWEDKHRGSRSVQVYAEKGTTPCIPELGSATEIAPHAFADATLSQIRAWLKECQSSHLKCPRLCIAPPRRLVDVGMPTPPSGTRKIRLVEDYLEPVKYIALSHCWGTDQPFTTTKSTLKMRLNEIAWNDLPKTYSDAVLVARKLHIRYIWIDSLCIIQDDNDDWDIESAKMASIYEDSFLTLAAALSPGDSHGFLGVDDNRSMYASQSVKGLHNTRIREIHDYRTVPSKDVLSTRAWVMQERLIPPRLLTFSLGVSFQCREADWCECGSGLFPDLMSMESNKWRRLDRAICRAALDHEDDPSRIYRFWLNSIVVPYSQKKLTKPSDRLPAISALAQKFEMKLDQEYLAGIWRHDMICGLSWRSQTRAGDEKYRDMSDHAPTWSWASVDGAVKFGYINEERRSRQPNLRMRCMDVDVQRRGFNQTGEVKSGALHAYGPCLGCFLTIEKQGKTPIYELIPLEAGFENAIVSNGILFDTALEKVEIEAEDGGEEIVSHLNRCKYGNEKGVEGNVLCLLLYQLPQDTVQFIRDFLVLGRAPEENTYQRLGILSLSSQFDGLQWFGELPERDVVIV